MPQQAIPSALGAIVGTKGTLSYDALLELLVASSTLYHEHDAGGQRRDARRC
ncbi:MAG: hypothetical protein ACLRSD_07395 [Oscillibacter sp.]